METHRPRYHGTSGFESRLRLSRADDPVTINFSFLMWKRETMTPIPPSAVAKCPEYCLMNSSYAINTRYLPLFPAFPDKRHVFVSGALFTLETVIPCC